jgi:deoxycytidylate deaminase
MTIRDLRLYEEMCNREFHLRSRVTTDTEMELLHAEMDALFDTLSPGDQRRATIIEFETMIRRIRT